MDEILKNMVEGIISMKCNEIIDHNFKDMNEREKAEREEADKKVSELEDKVKKEFTKDQWKLVSRLLDAEILEMTIEQKYLFSQGVKAGLTQLGFIKQELGDGLGHILSY